MSFIRRREFLGTSLVASVSIPSVLAGCTGQKGKSEQGHKETVTGNPTTNAGGEQPSILTPPTTRPSHWDPVAFNIMRGNSGAIPKSYMEQITAPEGQAKHLGKHLPYIPKTFARSRWEAGFVPLMFGDPELHFVRHPNAPKSGGNPVGHWYNWVRISVVGRPESEIETAYDNWPKPSGAVNGKIAALEGADPTADGGKNTVYLARLPEGAKAGDTLRFWGHCLTHGEYVDFLALT